MLIITKLLRAHLPLFRFRKQHSSHVRCGGRGGSRFGRVCGVGRLFQVGVAGGAYGAADEGSGFGIVGWNVLIGHG